MSKKPVNHTKGGAKPSASASSAPSGGLVSDSRFKHVHHDPRFVSRPKEADTVKLDDRFASMLDDDDFTSLTMVDKYGRKMAVKAQSLSKKFVRETDVDQQDDSSSDASEDEPIQKAVSGKPSSKSKVVSAPAPVKTLQKQLTHAKKMPAAPSDSDEDSPVPYGYGRRGDDSGDESSTSIGTTGDELDLDSSDEDDDDMDVYEIGEDGVKRPRLPGSIAGDLASITEEATSRLAIVNLEWTMMRAVDILAILRSFAPAGGEVKRVTVYPSKFGLERMEYESKFGPMFSLTDRRNAERALGAAADAENASGDEIHASDMEDEDEDGEQGMNWVELDEDMDDDAIETALAEANSDDDAEGDDDESLEQSDDGVVSKKAKSQKSSAPHKKNNPKGNNTKNNKNKGAKHEDEVANVYDEVESNYRIDHAEDGDRPDRDEKDYVNVEALRKYELEKLKYYYAIAECDSPATALHIYNEADNVEFERSSIVMDIRFVPDEQEFDDSIARESATRVPGNYKAPDFQTNALQQTRVKCTWDQDDPRRAKLLRANFTKADFEMEDLEAFLASEDSDAGMATDVPISDPDASTDEESEDSEMESAEDSEDEDGKSSRVNPPRSGGKVLLKRRARNRFAGILNELRSDTAVKPLVKKPESSSSDDDSDNEGGNKSKSSKEVKKSKKASYDEDDLSDVEITFEPALVSLSRKEAQTSGSSKQGSSSGFSSSKTTAKPLGKGKFAQDSDVSDNDRLVQSDEEWDKSDPFFRHSDDEADDIDEDFPKSSSKSKQSKSEESKTDKKKKKKGKYADEEETEASRKEKAELELLMLNSDDEEDASKREKKGYSLRQLLKDRKQSKKAEERKHRRPTEALTEDAVLEAALSAKRKTTLSESKPTKSAEPLQHKRVRQSIDDDDHHQEDFEINVADSRFSAVHSDPDFAIDPTSAAFKATEGTEKLLQESNRLRREASKQQEQALRERKERIRKANAAGRTDATREAKPSTSNKEELSSMVATLKARAALQALKPKK